MPGLEVDLDLGPVEIMAGVRAELSAMNRHLEAEAEHRRRETARARVPADVRLFAGATIPEQTVRTGINLGGPEAGFWWLLRRLVIGGLTWKTTAAGTAEVYVTGLGGNAGGAVTGPIIAALGTNDIVDVAATLPNKAFYTSHQVIVQEGENLMVVIDGGTGLQYYAAAAQFQVIRRAVSPESYTAS